MALPGLKGGSSTESRAFLGLADSVTASQIGG